MLCPSCSAVHINGILVHEYGCPDRYLHETVACFECGREYIADSLGEYRNRHRVCSDCRE